MGYICDEIAMEATRRPGTWSEGKWIPTPGAETTIPFRGGRPQPVGPEVLDMLPAGARGDARYLMFVDDTQPKLQTIDDDGTEAADYVTWRGEEHLLVSIEDWDDVQLGHRAYGLIAFAPDEVRP
jgi:hypothetical protein